MKILWITDPHLNFLPSVDSSRLLGSYLDQEHSFDAVVLSGDIAEAPTLRSLLTAFAQGVAPRPVYFVLGNHDYYNGSFGSVRRELRAAFEDQVERTSSISCARSETRLRAMRGARCCKRCGRVEQLSS